MADPGQPLPPCPHCGAAHPEEVLVCPNTNRLLPLEGRVLDNRFRFVRQLGEGGMSTVWLAENFRVRKQVAIKLMHPEFARNPRTLHRFQNEATAAGRIGNPHICDILDLGESPLGPYIVMEALQGSSFAELLDEQGRIDPPLAVLIICEALKGLAAAHAAGIIHRDLKPENVFLHEPEPGRMLVKLMDFGISKFTEDPGGGKTGANVVMGTPEYMSPEQAAGAANVDARTDIWAMGVMLYRALTGVEPFSGKTMAALLLALSMEDHAPISSFLPQLDSRLIAVVDRCLAKEPQHRFATALELFAALAPFQQAVAEGERPQAPVRTGKTMAIALDQVPTGPSTSRGAPSPGPLSTPKFATANTIATSGPIAPVSSVPPRGQTSVSKPGTKPGSVPGASGSDPNTWSSELGPPPDPDQSWSMGARTFNERESRPYTPTKERKGGWVGWLIGLGVVGLLGGGVALAWSQGWFATGDPEADSESETTGETGTVVAAEAGGEIPDLPSGETGASSAETGGTAGDESGGETGADTGDEKTDDTSGAQDSGGSSSGGSSSGGGSGGDSSDDQPIPIDFGNLIRQGSLYTHKSRGPNGTWSSAKTYCSGLKRNKRHGLTKWRLAKVSELDKFRSTDVDRLLYWSSESDGRKAKAVTMMNGAVSERAISDPAPRAFCVSSK
ncbi:Serine/threonine-protein kinase PknB [Enhygromyxa salina]|uniref:Serine/threonine-protein kinase PknB n=1 Tax=Enhygromyxa salina TaxID=215803 RepID=A0A2S9YJA3_9BACT|nr:protein kinase [Enhygromyxa salina]PRQ05185.1 Serine/threonine-protein kinase PknB [Enhygromyxa salina]